MLLFFVKNLNKNVFIILINSHALTVGEIKKLSPLSVLTKPHLLKQSNLN